MYLHKGITKITIIIIYYSIRIMHIPNNIIILAYFCLRCIRDHSIVSLKRGHVVILIRDIKVYKNFFFKKKNTKWWLS